VFLAFQGGKFNPKWPVLGRSGPKNSRNMAHVSHNLLGLTGRWVPRLVLAGAVAGMLGVMAATLNPVLDILSPMLWHFVGAACSAGIALLASKGRLAILGLGLTATVLAHSALGLWRQEHRVGNIAPPADIAETFRVVTVNAWHANRDLARLKAYLLAEDATFVVLTEFGPDKARLLAELKPSYPHQVSCAEIWFCSLALLSRVPLDSTGYDTAAAYRPPVVWARASIISGAPAITVVGTHLHRPSRNPLRNAAHVDQLIATLRRIEGPFILAGDLNAPATSSTVERLMASTGLAAPDCWLPTWPAWPVSLPQFALDHVLATTELSITRVSLGPAIGSDHLPVRAEVTAGKGGPVRCGRS
jgi:endonuclease/exonuclease/phosphatase (EEP) superfamily protein YafD